MGTVVALGGQVGGAKLAEGLYRLRGRDLAVIVNTGDDFDFLGLHVAPDIDCMLYALAGIADVAKGWEPAGETFACHGMLMRLRGPGAVPLGDRALALQLLRAEALRAERSLTAVTLDLAQRLGVEARVLPMSNDPVRTLVNTESGAMRFQDYFVDLNCEPAVRAFQYGGADEARLSDEVLDALHAHDLEAVVLGPCNPYHTMQPILAVNGMREALRKRGAPVIAVSPIIGGRALQGSAAKMMRELGREVSARAVAMEYYKLIDGFVVDTADEALVEGIRASGMHALAMPTLMRTAEDRLKLARAVLEFARAVRLRKEIAADA
ncbi:MAG: 2-phospho-L-lactate transferase [Betaproteobacteria bacterium]|nr:2-phospho-L-lactate transferase [Betaproteobacteria bacterium]MDH4324147.1 2-phospho-L-lactate transferase [Betaproteobacteria bacterium]MDH5578545.1 2-phospho-L-lactate transferase [Betaproteobacteria bacterium]